MATLHGELLRLCASRGNRIGFRIQLEKGGYRELSYADYADSALRFSGYLNAKGVKPGDRVLLLSENGPEWTAAALAVMNLGAVLVPVASISAYADLENVIKTAAPRFFILSCRAPATSQIKAELKSAGRECDLLEWDLQHAEPLPSSAALPLAEDMTGDRVATIIFTSGTTGHPKGVPLTHENILTNSRDVLTVITANRDDRVVSVLPLSHMLEFMGGFVVPTLVGASITYLKSLKPEDLLKALKDQRATVLIAVPLLFEVISRNLQGKIDSLPRPVRALFRSFGDLVEKIPALGKILFYPVHSALGGNVRFFVAGGAKLQPQTFGYFKRLGITLLQGYGLTETSPVLTLSGLGNAGPEHVGTVMPSIDVGVFSDSFARLPPGQEGEICAKGPSVLKGYLNPDHDKDVFHDGWFRTGDLGMFGADGHLRITGRKKDIIVTSAGKNVYPEEIEQFVAGSFPLLEIAVLGIVDKQGHEKICLVAVPDRSKFLGKNNEQITAELARDIADACLSLSEYKRPQQIEIFFQEMPKTLTRKVKKHEVRKILAERAENKTEASGASEFLSLSVGLERAVAEGVATITGIDKTKVPLDASFTKDLGLDSLTFVELVGAVEKAFQVKVDGVDFTTIQTVRDLVTALQFVDPAAAARGPVRFSEFAPEENWRFLFRFPRRVFNVFLRAHLRISHDLEVHGVEHVVGQSRLIFTPNHASHFDLLTVASAVPGSMVHYTFAVAAKDYFFDKPWKGFIARVVANAIPFDRKGRVDVSMRRCVEALDVGGSLTIFPEGTRSPNGQLQPFKAGVGQLLAGNSQVRAVPVHIQGAFEIFPKGAKFPGPGKLKVRFGRPISFADLPANSESFAKIAKTLQEEVVKLSQI